MLVSRAHSSFICTGTGANNAINIALPPYPLIPFTVISYLLDWVLLYIRFGMRLALSFCSGSGTALHPFRDEACTLDPVSRFIFVADDVFSDRQFTLAPQLHSGLTTAMLAIRPIYRERTLYAKSCPVVFPLKHHAIVIPCHVSHFGTFLS